MNQLELEAFVSRLKEYQARLRERKESGFSLGRGPNAVVLGEKGADQGQEVETLREQLIRESGRFKTEVVKLTSKQYVTQFGITFDVWAEAFQRDPNNPRKLSSLQAVIDCCNEAIGILEAGTITSQSKPSVVSPKAFIAHGGKTRALDRLCEFLRALGIEPIVVELRPSHGQSIDRQVGKHIQDSDCGIVFATKGGIRDIKSGTEHPRLNVIDEFARLRSKFPDKVILLLENGVDLPSNVSEFVHESFSKDNLERAFLKVAKELRSFGIIRAEKPGV